MLCYIVYIIYDKYSRSLLVKEEETENAPGS